LNKNEFDELNNTTEWHQLYGWEHFIDPKKKPTIWSLLAQGTKEQMLWVMKVHIKMMLCYGRGVKRYEEVLALFASYLILTPENEALEIPAFKDINPWSPDITLDEQTEHNMRLLDQLPKLHIIYKDMAKIKQRGMLG